MDKKTCMNVVDLLKEPPSKERDNAILLDSIYATKQMGVWAKDLQDALHEKKKRSVKHSLELCEKSFVSLQSFSIGCLSR